jgi:hypothetical protein
MLLLGQRSNNPQQQWHTQHYATVKQPPLVVMSVVGDCVFRPTKHERAREANIHPRIHVPMEGQGWWVTGCVTPRQTCLQPNGFRRNLRSKTRWFTGFCNSHQVSHFATFFIDARAEISVAESRLVLRNMRAPHPTNGCRRAFFSKIVLGAVCAGFRYLTSE